MADKINNNTVPDGTINGISESSFDKLNDDQKQIVLTGNIRFHTSEVSSWSGLYE